MDILLQTKLNSPLLQENLVLRQRLVDQLKQAAHCRLILVSAPAGFGKSTLVASWLQQTDHPVAWLALDEWDDDPLHFWRYVTAALATEIPALQEQSATWFATPDASLSRTIPSLLVNLLASSAVRLTLVLDDYHLIHDNTIHQGIDFLLDHLPPRHQLLIISRTDPPLALPRLRARNQLCEIRTDELRFGHNETTHFLRDRMRLTLNERDIYTLEERTEGWVAGLQFTGLSLQKLSDNQAIHRFISRLTGRDRHIVDYLMTEVLSRQAPELQHFLLRTAILEQLSAPLCNSLLQRQDSQLVLNEIERANLFIVALDNERHWYRYHHLFAELLRDRARQALSSDEYRQLHHHAYQWYQQHEIVEQAVHHALEAGEQGVAAKLLVPQIFDGQWRPNAFLRIRRWADRLDESTLQAYPRLLMAALEANLMTFRATRVEHCLHLLETHTALPADVEALLMNTQANLLRLQRDNDGAKTLLRNAMTLAPEDDFHVQLNVRLQMAILLFETGEVDDGTKLLREVVEMAETMDHHFTSLLAAGYLSLLMMGQGRLHEAEAMMWEMIAKAEQQQIEVTVTTSMLYIGLSILYYEWNDLDRAESYCERGLAQSELVEIGDMLWQGYQMQAQLALLKNDLPQLIHLREKAKELLNRLDVTTIADALHRFYDFFEADISLRLGDLETVEIWVARYHPSDAPIATDRWFIYELYVRFIFAQLDVAQPAHRPLSTLVALLQTLVQHVESIGMGQAAIRFRNLLAQCHWRLDESDLAFKQLLVALHRAIGEGYIRTFLDDGEQMHQLLQALNRKLTAKSSTEKQPAEEQTLLPYLNQLLAAFAQETSQQRTEQQGSDIADGDPSGLDPNEDRASSSNETQSLVEALTDREQEILELIAAGHTNQEIANELVITLSTVKRHISNLYGKLGVNHRTQAVAQAQQFGLIRNE